MTDSLHRDPARGRQPVPDMGDEMHTLPIDPVTRIRALAVLPSGRIVWPIAGGDGTDGNAGAGDGKPGAGAGKSEGQAASGKEAELQAELEKWKALARQHESLWKATGLSKDDLPEAKALLAKAKELETSSKTADDRVAALERKIADAEAKSMRLEIAAAKGLSPTMARRLMGSTREELEADADALKAEFKPAENGNGSGGNGTGGEAAKGSGGTPANRARPREDLRSGSAPQAEPEENDPSKLAAQIPRG